jgi:signal transduction histidine kinase
MTAATRQISEHNLHERLALSGPDDELKQLATTIDELLERLETSFEAQRQFVANASHELRTPLTLERALVEVALADPRASVETLRHMGERVLATGTQQERLIEALLTLSRSQRGLERHQPVDLAATTLAALQAVAHDRLTVTSDLQPAWASGDPALLERLVTNLISNAVDHNLPAGQISAVTATRAGRATLTVTNTGPSVPRSELERLFQPFQRLETRRATNTHGVGLGLPIIRAIADAHHATLDVQARAEGGLEITVTFPASTAAHRAPGEE